MSAYWVFARKLKVICLLLSVVLVLALVSGCGQKNRSNASPLDAKNIEEIPASQKRELVLSSERSQVTVYFATEDLQFLVPMTVSINPTQEVAKVAVEKLLAGPSSQFVARTIPEETKLKDIFLTNTETVYVDLTDSFLELDSEEAVLLALDSLVFTLTELPEISKVKIYVEGKQVSDIHGVDLKKSFAREKGVNYRPGKESSEEQATVFYGEPNGVLLVPVTFDIQSSGEFLDRARKAFDLLVSGPPEDSGLINPVWPGTKILGIDYHEAEKTLIIDFSKEVTGYGGGTTAERLLINSVLYTAFALKGADVAKVQFLIEGQKIEYLPEGTEIDQPLPKPDKINCV
ncbi:MAG: GerMN domain-containing protein [Bacillota bacterium]|jgi:germination protein M